MDDAKAERFVRWMVDVSEYTDDEPDVRGYVRQLGEVEQAERINPDGNFLDDEFRLNGLVRLYELYKYWAKDARVGRPNPTQMILHDGELVRELTKYRSRINQYKQFCEYEAGLEEARILEGG